MQDTPDASKNFHYGNSRIAKQHLGIVKLCEDFGMECTIYQHWDMLEKPIVSRHGPKGGRFIDGMYTYNNIMSHIQGITIVHDTGISSDHDMIISKCDLGIEKFIPSQDKEERCDFRSIMNISVTIKRGQDHPSLDDNVYKGVEYHRNKNLFYSLQEVIHDPKLHILEEVEFIKNELKEFEQQIILRTKTTITEEDQQNGKLIQRLPADAQIINNMSIRFFEAINNVCQNTKL